MQFVLKEITSRGVMSAGKKMGYVNNFTKVVNGQIIIEVEFAGLVLGGT